MKQFVFSKQTVILGDCEEELKAFQDESVNIVVTSPPYNIDLRYKSYKDKKENYLGWLHGVFSEIKRVLVRDGSIFLNVGAININPWISFDIAQILRDLFILQNHIIWCKSISISKKQSFGHYKPINSGRYLNYTFENIFHFTKFGDVKIDRKSIGVPFVDKINLQAKTITDDIRCRGNVWYIPYETIQSKEERGEHPAIFPKDLVRMCVKLHGYNENTVVLDPFLGTGTTLIVCEELQCIGKGIELVEEYFGYSCSEVSSAVLEI